MESMSEIESYLISKGMPPRATPVGIAELGDHPLMRVGSGTTGLKKSTTINQIDSYDINKDVIPSLKKLNFGRYVPDYYDCEDRALWGMAHLRHMLPGLPVGVVSGTARDGPNNGEDHAVIMLWKRAGDDIEPVCWEPDPRGQGVINFGNDIQSIVAYPPDGAQNTPPVAGSLDNTMLVWDRKRVVYHKDDIMGYLKNGDYEKKCDDQKTHSITNNTIFNRLWSSYDRALWAFVHARRHYPGCPVGVAKGDKVDGKSSWTVIVFHFENDKDGGNLVWTYWDPKENSEVKFKPKMIFI